MDRLNWKETAEKLLFMYGKQVLGQNSGGMIVKLIKQYGFEGAMLKIELAAKKQDAREFLAAALKEKEQMEISTSPMGDRQFVEFGTAAWKDYEKEYRAKHGRYPVEKSHRIDGGIKQGRYTDAKTKEA